MPERVEGVCREVTELIPFLRNGSLEADRAARVRLHLADCEACRGEAVVWDRVAEIHATHPAADDLTAFAFGEADEDTERAIADHLAVCGPCRQLVEAAERVHGLPPADAISDPSEVRTVRRQSPSRSAWALVAASLLVALGSVFWSWWSFSGARSGWEAQRAVLEERVRELRAPRADVPVVELFSTRDAVRSGDLGETAASAELSLDMSPVLLLLYADSAEAFDAYRLEVRSPLRAGAVLHRIEELEPQSPGAFSVLLPRESLEPGLAVLEVAGLRGDESEVLGRFPVRIRSGSPTDSD